MTSSSDQNYRSILYVALLCLGVVLAILILSYRNAFVPVDESAANTLGINIGILGDSGTDEYRADNNRGGVYANVTFNWLEQFVRNRGVNAGPWGTRSEPRRIGYEYNWARSGAVSADLLSTGQAAGLASQVSQGKVNFVVVWIGINDFADYNNAYAPIYNGTLSGSALVSKVNTMASNIEQAVNQVMAAGAPKLVVASVPDWGQHPAIIKKYPDATKRQRVSNAVAEVNKRLKTLAEGYNGLYLLIDDYSKPLLAQLDPVNFTFNFEGEIIKFLETGDEPHHFILGDNIHGGTIAEGLILQYLIKQFNAKWQMNIPELTNQEILVTAGLRTATFCRTDINQDGITDIQDYGLLAADYFKTAPTNSRSDINSSGLVDIDDYALLVGNFFKTTCN